MANKGIIKLASGAEDKFIELFSEVFGPEKTNKLYIQYGVNDIYGGSRYIDFAILTDKEKIAIEVDGEGVHEPGKVSHEKYYDDLLKQNSMIYDNWKVYRWTDGQFKRFPEKVKDEMYTFLGESLEEGKEDYLFKQTGKAIELRDYQEEALKNLEDMRANGDSIALLYHATGTGKTVTAVEDAKSVGKRTLFIAHTKELITQAKEKFDLLWKDIDTGLFMGDIKEKEAFVVCSSIQSISENLEQFNKDDFKYLIIDEAHHATANSYGKVLDYFEPEFTLGLTATPERNDNQDIFKFFEDRISGEIRLPEAIDRKLLSPFQYFAVSDTVDLSKLKWQRRGYSISDLNNVYTGNDKRVSDILVALNKYVTDIDEVVGLGFCVSKEHAKFMANKFNEAGIESIALTSESKKEERDNAKERLVKGEIKFIFVVDIYNEGVDIPEINTILFLRPTESLTVFLQQLGRGLRLHDKKECLTVLDFVGQSHKNYNFEDKFRALIGKTNKPVKDYIENGFLTLPKGCYIQLEKEAKEYILRNIKSASNTKANLLSKLRSFKNDTDLELTLENFLKYHNLSLVDFYGKTKDRSFSRMCVIAEQRDDFTEENEVEITKKLYNLLFVNSRRFIEFVIGLIKNNDDISNVEFTNEESLMLNMMYYIFYNDAPEKIGLTSIKEGINKLLNNKVMMNEACEILKYNFDHLNFVDKKVNLGFDCPLDLHCDYSTDVIMAAFGYYNEEKKPAFREGVKYFEDKGIDIFFITLNKSDKDFSPSTLYEDYAINERLFHWQTQSKTSTESATGKRYINHLKTGNKIALFVREYKTRDGLTSPFTYLGTCEYRSHSGNKPISFIWELNEEIPPSMINKANKTIII